MKLRAACRTLACSGFRRGAVPSSVLAGMLAAGTATAALPWRELGGSDGGIVAALAAAVCAVLAVGADWQRRLQARECVLLRTRLAQEQDLRDHTERALRATQASLGRLAANRQADRAATRAASRDAERRRIGRDIHDDLGQHLLALQLDIGGLHADPRLPAWLRQHTERIERHVGLTTASLRAIINDLRPAALERGLRQAVRCQVEEFARRTGLRCRFDAAGLDRVPAAGPTPSAAAETAVFRILQEALSNVLRHAAATEVRVALGRDAMGLVLTVRDNGVGMQGETGTGAGLAGMGERVAAAGGRLDLDSRPGRGTTLTIAVPLLAGAALPDGTHAANHVQHHGKHHVRQHARNHISNHTEYCG